MCKSRSVKPVGARPVLSVCVSVSSGPPVMGAGSRECLVELEGHWVVQGGVGSEGGWGKAHSIKKIPVPQCSLQYYSQ